MFQGLTQGSTLSILYRNIPNVVDGRVTSVNTHMPQFNPQQPMTFMNGPVTDITVQVGSDTIPFAGLPANGGVANFPDKGIFISTDKSAVLRELDSTVASLKQDLEAVPAKEKLLQGYEALRLDLNPGMKKDAQQEREMTELKSEVTEMKSLLRELLGKAKTTKDK